MPAPFAVLRPAVRMPTARHDPGIGHDATLACLLSERGGLFDPARVDAFIATLEDGALAI